MHLNEDILPGNRNGLQKMVEEKSKENQKMSFIQIKPNMKK
jgi:hypothetical protein